MSSSPSMKSKDPFIIEYISSGLPCILKQNRLVTEPGTAHPNPGCPSHTNLAANFQATPAPRVGFGPTKSSHSHKVPGQGQQVQREVTSTAFLHGFPLPQERGQVPFLRQLPSQLNASRIKTWPKQEQFTTKLALSATNQKHFLNNFQVCRKLQLLQGGFRRNLKNFKKTWLLQSRDIKLDQDHPLSRVVLSRHSYSCSMMLT